MEEKQNIKKTKKLEKENIKKTKKLEKKIIKEEKILKIKTVKSTAKTSLAPKSANLEFENLVKNITEKNILKPFPNINDIPD